MVGLIPWRSIWQILLWEKTLKTCQKWHLLCGRYIKVFHKTTTFEWSQQQSSYTGLTVHGRFIWRLKIHIRLWNPNFHLFRFAIIHLWESPWFKTTHVKHNCASLCDIVKEQITRLALSVRHRHKQQTVFFHLLQLHQ